MAGKSKGGNTISTVWEIVEPYAKQLDLEIWDIRFVKEGATHYLRIFIDKEGGVGLDDCVDLSHAIDNPLDDADPIDCSYCLEVSTPGIERELIRPEHFESKIGQRIKLKLIRAVDNQREFNGTLKGFGNGQIIMVLEDGEEKSFDKKDTSWVRLDDFDISDN
ncbi:MAG: ribosome maturation factor RimP [Clostridia bacterium]|nr:ribosome maturation factor RimP [Clostridia bacterium]